MFISIKISRNSAFSGSDKPRMLFFLLINVKMPTTVGIWTFLSKKNVMLSWDEHKNSFITSGTEFLLSARFMLKVCSLVNRHARIINPLRWMNPCATAVELQWLEHLWDHENYFETGVVRANEGWLLRQARCRSVDRKIIRNWLSSVPYIIPDISWEKGQHKRRHNQRHHQRQPGE